MRMLLITITIFNDINQQMSNCPGFIIFSRKMVEEYQSQPKSSSMIRAKKIFYTTNQCKMFEIGNHQQQLIKKNHIKSINALIISIKSLKSK
ncbi:hypothetical protein DERF_011465 [Dermatophagoides farinae]|uniref:Uncharacterized protein n=1 Tax=Dermatophagoides farinae TaxID=6954 RepID=A0A922HS93_DERFA|nr:hypothetical protein DERF_011465 [Dermatophagoides farinae]